MNEITNGKNTPAALWRSMPAWARGAIIFVVGLILGAGAATPAQEKIDRADAITSKEQSIYKAAEQKRAAAETDRDRLLAEQTDLKAQIAKQESAASVRERRAERTLAKLKREIRGARNTIAKRSFEGDGMYIVGEDIEPGTYKAAASPGCYWARLASGDTSDIIDNDIVDGPAVISVAASDYAVDVARCGEFRK